MLLFDNREHGISDGHGLGMSLGLRESEDVSSAIDNLIQNKGVKRVALIGSSLGATSAILSAARDTRIHAVITQGTGTTPPDMMAANPILAWFPRWTIDLFYSALLFSSGCRFGGCTFASHCPRRCHSQDLTETRSTNPGRTGRDGASCSRTEEFRGRGDPKELWMVKGGQHPGLRQHVGEEYTKRVLEFFCEHLPIASANNDPRRSRGKGP